MLAMPSDAGYFWGSWQSKGPNKKSRLIPKDQAAYPS